MKIKTIFCRLDGTQAEREIEVPDDYFAVPADGAVAADTADTEAGPASAKSSDAQCAAS